LNESRKPTTWVGIDSSAAALIVLVCCLFLKSRLKFAIVNLCQWALCSSVNVENSSITWYMLPTGAHQSGTARTVQQIWHWRLNEKFHWCERNFASNSRFLLDVGHDGVCFDARKVVCELSQLDFLRHDCHAHRRSIIGTSRCEAAWVVFPNRNRAWSCMAAS